MNYLCLWPYVINSLLLFDLILEVKHHPGIKHTDKKLINNQLINCLSHCSPETFQKDMLPHTPAIILTPFVSLHITTMSLLLLLHATLPLMVL